MSILNTYSRIAFVLSQESYVDGHGRHAPSAAGRDCRRRRQPGAALGVRSQWFVGVRVWEVCGKCVGGKTKVLWGGVGTVQTN